MSTFIFTNGKYYNPATKTTERLNLLIENGILAGQGYLPDEDETAATVIDIPNHYIVPNILMTELLLEFDEKQTPLTDLIPTLTQEFYDLNPLTIPTLTIGTHPSITILNPNTPENPISHVLIDGQLI